MSGAKQHITPETSVMGRVELGWGRDIPDWILTLAHEVDITSQRRVATRTGINATTINKVLANKYEASTARIEERIRGALMAKTVNCPVLGEIGAQRCISEQGKKLTFENPLRQRVYHACRGGCPHSRLGDGK